MIGAVFLLCLTGFTIMDMEFRRIHQAIERSERRTKKLQRQLAVLHFTEADRSTKGRNVRRSSSVCVLFNKSL